MKSTKPQRKSGIPRRQWGTERDTTPLGIVHEIPSVRKIALSRIAIIVTVLFWIAYVTSTIARQLYEGPHTYRFTLESTGYLLVMTLLTFSALMYLIARQGAFMRFSKHVRPPRAELEKYFSTHQPSITTLVPSYNEEPDVIYKTLLSAALQEYPSMRIVLLMDDNPHTADAAAAKRLDETRNIGRKIEKLLSVPAKHARAALSDFETKPVKQLTVTQIRKLAREYIWSADWLNTQADKIEINDHVDMFFTDQVLRALADELRLTAAALNASATEKGVVPYIRALRLYYRLVWIFTTEMDVFERKRYASLSHEANKAMNINSYIGLMGSKFYQQATPEGPVLIPISSRRKADTVIPDADFVLTLDADSVLLRDYCLRLVYYAMRPGNEKVAVVQTPYSSFRGAFSRIERLAGATTDLQHILHQGKTYYGATFWVGANAIIRKKALDEIVEKEWVGGFEIKRYVQDRTVIEDTESSVDLALKGWKLVNYPERLSYSATPPDFGSLIVQRRRWANGGLLIMPKLIRRHREHIRLREPVSYIELFLRSNYMASIAWASFGLVFLLAYPYDSRLLSPLVLMTALPYFLAQASDLHYCGYKRSDIFRIYGFNLILLPVNLAGVLKSMQQAITGKKIPFARTPKVKNRTIAPFIYIAAPIAIIAFSIYTCERDFVAENWANAAFAAFNTVVASWAFVSYIGIGNALADIWRGATDWLYVDVKPQAVKKKAILDTSLNWQAVLYHGDTDRHLPLGVTYDQELQESSI
ncbi:MAG TPA: glycosyltransferase family 2 protein [Candidatus Bathyarchaeia archaeon]|nr:glycosyltransferase family 2 protein [Candidatus Bathyarchaeia archaeon]